MKKRFLFCLLVFAIIFSLLSFSYTSAESFEIEELPPAENAVALSEVPYNIKSLISDQTEDKVFLVSDPADKAEMFTLRTENSKTGEGTLTVHSVPVKYMDRAGKLQFIDTSMETLTAAESAKHGFAYCNSANSFTVEFGDAASKGVNFNNAFTVEADANTAGSRSGEAQIEKGAGKITYPSVFVWCKHGTVVRPITV